MPPEERDSAQKRYQLISIEELRKVEGTKKGLLIQPANPPYVILCSATLGVSLLGYAEDKTRDPFRVSLSNWTTVGVLWSHSKTPFGTKRSWGGMVYQFRKCKWGVPGQLIVWWSCVLISFWTDPEDPIPWIP